VRELQRHIKTRGFSEKEYIGKARASGVRSSDYIRCVSPTPGQPEISSSDSTGHPSTSSGFSFVGGKPAIAQEMGTSKSSGTSRARQVQVSQQETQPADATPSWAADMPDLTPDNVESSSSGLHSTSTYSTPHASNCDQVQQELGFMLIQTISPHALTAFPNVRDVEAWQLVSPPDEAAEEHMCTKCDTPSRSHSPFPPGWLWDSASELPQQLSYQTLDPSVQLQPGSDEVSIFQASCYAACMYGGQGRYDLLAKSLQRADQIFEKMIRDNNSMTLLSVLLTLNILHAHEQGDMAASIVRSAHHVACNMLGEGNSVTLAIEWTTAAAGSKISQSRIKVGTLRAVLADLQRKYGEKHNNSVAALYCLAFHLAYEKEYPEAESLFEKASEICKETLGPKHLQTVACLNGLSRAQARQNKHGQAIATLQASIASHPLGPNHPFRLESMRRLALIYKKINRNDLVEPIYWAVLRGRIKTLGKSHTQTETARTHLERLLQTTGKWDAEGRKAQEIKNLFEDGSAALTSDIEAF
jgi:tetratricopeptide (TPR) repeat protein